MLMTAQMTRRRESLPAILSGNRKMRPFQLRFMGLIPDFSFPFRLLLFTAVSLPPNILYNFRIVGVFLNFSPEVADMHHHSVL